MLRSRFYENIDKNIVKMLILKILLKVLQRQKDLRLFKIVNKHGRIF